MNPRTYSLTAVAVIASMFALAGCGSKDGAQAATAPAAPPPTEVDVVSVDPGSVVVTQDLPGRLEAYRSSQIRARVEGIIEKRLFEEGSDVKAGTPLFQLDARNYRAAYDSAK